MLKSTYEATKGLLKADPSISLQERNRILKAIEQGGDAGTQSQPQEPPRILRRKEVAERLGGISLRTVDVWAGEGVITKIKLPGHRRASGFSSDEIDSLARGLFNTSPSAFVHKIKQGQQ